jgi:hypothetical protein
MSRKYMMEIAKRFHMTFFDTVIQTVSWPFDLCGHEVVTYVFAQQEGEETPEVIDETQK